VTDDHLSPDGHLSLADLAELDEDLLEPDRAESARAHLAGCDTCQARLAELTATRERLRDLPRAEIPADVASRIETALADAGAPAATVVPMAGATGRRRFGRPTAAASAAAAAVVLLVGAIVVALVHHSGNNGSGSAAGALSVTPSATTGLSPQQPKDYRLSASGKTYTPTTLQSLVPGLVTSATRVPGAPQADAGGAVQTPAASPTHGPVTTGSGKNSSPTGETFSGAGKANSGLVPSLAHDYGNRSWLLSCARYLTGESDAVPIAIDFGRFTDASYSRAPSIVFVFRDADPNYVDVYVSGPTCQGTDAVRTYQKVGMTQ
jgi:hypothetical protein